MSAAEREVLNAKDSKQHSVRICTDHMKTVCYLQACLEQRSVHQSVRMSEHNGHVMMKEKKLL